MKTVKICAAAALAAATAAAMSVNVFADAERSAAIRLATANGLETQLYTDDWMLGISVTDDEYVYQVYADVVSDVLPEGEDKVMYVGLSGIDCADECKLGVETLAVDINIPYDEFVGRIASAYVWVDGEIVYSVDNPTVTDYDGYMTIDLSDAGISGFTDSIGVTFAYEQNEGEAEDSEPDTYPEDVEEPDIATENEPMPIADEIPVGVETEATEKGSPDTGAQDVAVFAGLAVLAAGAAIIAKKRG